MRDSCYTDPDGMQQMFFELESKYVNWLWDVGEHIKSLAPMWC